MTSACVRFGILAVLAVALVRGAVADDEPAAEQAEFFEREVRPLLIEHCHKCHGPKVQKGGLRLDSRDAVLKGGETGPAVQPGDVKASLLIEAINYDPDGYQMPPDGKLPAEKIAVLTEWVRRGAPWPKSVAPSGGDAKTFDLAERARHWSFQPIQRPEIPDVRHADQAANPVDRFLLSRLESHELQFSPPAEKSILLRRLSIELTGLSPTPDELDAFLADAAPDACERVVDRLLASPRYGERWARHWLDLVRFAETYGHEFDYEIRLARPYRDYVIRAWNADVPYHLFVREHVAGDLLPDPRRDAATGKLESVIGTAFWWFGQGKHSPVDIRAEECDTVDNQLDVFGKTFLGLTVACARCHDHKFDPISQKDYYALAGFLQSSRQTHADVNPPEWTADVVSELERNDRAHRSHLVLSTLDRLQPFVDRFADLLLSKGDIDRSALERRGDKRPASSASLVGSLVGRSAAVAEPESGPRTAPAGRRSRRRSDGTGAKRLPCSDGRRERTRDVVCRRLCVRSAAAVETDMADAGVVGTASARRGRAADVGAQRPGLAETAGDAPLADVHD
jgi:cytochrome c553